MSECEKNKAGLQKKVSSVFKGVPIPQGSGDQQTSGTHAPGQMPGTSARPMSPDCQSPSALVRRLHKVEEIPDNRTPNPTAKADPDSVTAAHQRQPLPAARELYEIKTPPEEAASAKQPKAAPAAEATGPNLWQQINDKLFAPKQGVSPTRQKAMIILVPILAIVAIFMVSQVFSTSPRKTHAAAGRTGAPVKAKPSHEIDWQIPDPLPATMRDPIKFPDKNPANDTEPNQASEEPKTDLIDVRGIVYSSDKPSAFINGRIVYVGDKIGEMTIIKIDRDSVEFERGGKRWVQNVHP